MLHVHRKTSGIDDQIIADCTGVESTVKRKRAPSPGTRETGEDRMIKGSTLILEHVDVGL
jgi:hypothetical protein